VADIQNGGTVVATLADDGCIHLRATVDENDVARLRVDQPAAVRIDAFPGETFPGRVRKISSSGTSEGSVASFEIEVEIDPDPRVRVGMSADARIVVQEHPDALLVPNAAIVRTEQGPRVRLARGAEGDAHRLAPIEEIASDGFETAVAQGLAEGDVVLLRAEPGVATP
jgi:HlyD family secretion protein